jgi:hypothetical protein
MLCWPRIRWWWSRNNRRWTVGRPHAGSDGAACVVAAAVQTVCAKASCRAGSTETDEEDPIMTIPPELEAQILRYYHVEKWRIGTVARQLRVHPETVARVLAKNDRPVVVGTYIARASIVSRSMRLGFPRPFRIKAMTQLDCNGDSGDEVPCHAPQPVFSGPRPPCPRAARVGLSASPDHPRTE